MIVPFLFLVFPGGACAQALWLEGGGGTPTYALQYEQPLSSFGKRGLVCAGRVGVGIERTRIAVPISIHAWSSGRPHHLAFMAGATPQIRNLDVQNTDTYLLLVAGVGYRYSHSKSRLMLSVMGHPLLITDPTPTQLIDRNPDFRFRLSIGIGLEL